MARINTLDYLRGLMACFIMCYHFLFWSDYHFTSADFFGKIGVYGVSVFYVLSGITLFVVYNNRINFDFKSIASFTTKRIFRIFPLLWFITIGTILTSKKHYDFSTITLNLTGVFGFVKPDAYIGNGVWSIGNELVFYAFFPLIIIAAKYSKYIFFAFVLLLSSIGVYFAFICLSPEKILGEQWEIYVNPFNQIILFTGGILIAYLLKANSLTQYKTFLRLFLLAIVLLFIFYPVVGDTINIVSGWNRIIFCLISFIVCACIYVDNYNFPSIIHKSLSFIGETSYSIYLVHPLVFVVINGFNQKHLHLNYIIILAISIISTFIGSYFIYRFIEKPMINVGKSVTTKYLSS